MAVDSQALARQDEQRGIATADPEQAAGALAHILATGDLAKLTNEQRVGHYLSLCQSLDLNPHSRPFDWLTLDNKLVLYPNKSCAEQLRRQHQISVKVTRREVVGELFCVEVEGRTPSGRTDQATKYVPLVGQRGKLTGKDLANAFAKAETGAKRRLVLSMVGLASPPDPEEIKGAKIVVVDGTGRIIENPTPEQKALAENPDLARIVKEPVYEDMGPEGSPLAGTPDQRVTPDELERPAEDRPRPTFKVDEEETERFRGAWFATVKGLSLDSDDARHQYVAAWTADEWPKAKRTDSLTTMRARMTDGEAADFLAHVRALCEDERRELLSQAVDGGEERGRSGNDVADAVRLTGGPESVDESERPAF